MPQTIEIENKPFVESWIEKNIHRKNQMKEVKKTSNEPGRLGTVQDILNLALGATHA
jgi:hypothetical protein